MIVPNDATHATVLVIEFADGGPPEETVLQFGTFEECDAVARSLPAASYSGERPLRGAHISVLPAGSILHDLRAAAR